MAKSLGDPMTDEELQEMLQEADKHKQGFISEASFTKILKKTTLF